MTTPCVPGPLAGRLGYGSGAGSDAERSDGGERGRGVKGPRFPASCAFNQAHCDGSAGGGSPEQQEMLLTRTAAFMSGVMPLSHGQYHLCMGCQIVSVFYNYDERSEE